MKFKDEFVKQSVKVLEITVEEALSSGDFVYTDDLRENLAKIVLKTMERTQDLINNNIKKEFTQ